MRARETTDPLPDGRPPARGGDTLLGLMAFGVIAATAAIAGFCVVASWWLLPLIMLTLIGLTIGIAYALVHLMVEHDLRAPAPPARAAGERRARQEAVPLSRVAPGH